ncbi:g4685 [Coccomyxa viridis]|uniref:G4685 protein n=1 Tax=Coccomyxa viridis TaxID=1274662 RepID=A0ABP1FTJ8_9CHLO
MAAFTVGMCVVPYYAGKVVMAGTNMRAEEGTSLEQKLRARQTLEHKVLARANRERLRVLLSEAEQGRLGNNERYAAALRGESLGTHSRGTTVGAQNIRDMKPSS